MSEGADLDSLRFRCLPSRLRRHEIRTLASEDIAAGRLMPTLKHFDPGNVELIRAVFFGGGNMPARVRVFVDFLAARLAA